MFAGSTAVSEPLDAPNSSIGVETLLKEVKEVEPERLQLATKAHLVDIRLFLLPSPSGQRPFLPSDAIRTALLDDAFELHISTAHPRIIAAVKTSCQGSLTRSSVNRPGTTACLYGVLWEYFSFHESSFSPTGRLMSPFPTLAFFAEPAADGLADRCLVVVVMVRVLLVVTCGIDGWCCQ